MVLFEKEQARLVALCDDVESDEEPIDANDLRKDNEIGNIIKYTCSD